MAWRLLFRNALFVNEKPSGTATTYGVEKLADAFPGDALVSAAGWLCARCSSGTASRGGVQRLCKL